MTQPEIRPEAPRAGDSRRILGLVFLVLFLDLVGFSIIFPLFPSMLAYYQTTSGGAGLFGLAYRLLEQFSALAGSPAGEWGVIVLFGGVLGSLYSVLQFLCAPVFGRLSDRVGRKPVLLLCLAGLAVSYVMWFFARGFGLLVLARVVGGMMSGNISTATAVVADITDLRSRSRGMALVGVAFGVGFIVGPAVGGAASLLDLTRAWPWLAGYGVNPYSAAALAALVLTVANLCLVARYLPETRPAAASEPAPVSRRTSNPLALFSAGGYPGVAWTNLAYFLFLLAFSGMEFSLTFLAADRLGFGPGDNALMFVYIGLILAGMQGFYVHRYSGMLGPKRMALHGMLCAAPGLALIGLAARVQSVGVLLAGLALLAGGGAQILPCLTALVSMYTPPHDQGRVMGVFRSLGALARALGPLIACVLYWRGGPAFTYAAGAMFVVAPFVLTRRLPPTQSG